MSGALTTTTGFAIEGMQGAMNLAKAMASARMVPQHLQGSPGDCLMVIEQAMRWQMSPFAVAQATAVVRGKMCFEGKLVAAAIQTSGILEGRLRYEFKGQGDERTVICFGHIRGEAKERTVEVELSSAKTSNEWWTKTPDQMLTYHAARVWARRHTPEVMLGVYSPDEFDTQPSREPIDVTPQLHQFEPSKTIDHKKIFADRLSGCTDALAVDAQWDAFQRLIKNAEGGGRPIPEDTQSFIQDMIAEKRAEFDQQAAETPIEEPAV